MACDVVVVNYKTPDLLDDFCASYESHKFEGCTLTVVDVTLDSPYPGQTAERYDAEFISFADNVGYGRACNEGAAGGVNDVILLANADTRLSAGFRDCYDALAGIDHWGVLGPRQVDADGLITAGGIMGPDRSPSQRGWQHSGNSPELKTVRDDVISVSGALYFIKRKVWGELTTCELFQDMQPDSVGAFLETQHYFEEMWCSLHARAHGYKCVYYGPVVMTHLWHKASPHGGFADQHFARSQEMHRRMCAHHGIESE
jgi:GT2 family glycosyltransferase